MDGMLLITFFFPLLTTVNMTLSVLTFLLTLIVSFGPEISQFCDELLGVDLLTRKWKETPLSKLEEIEQTSIFLPLLVSGVTIWTTMTTYGIGGAARHGKTGWKFVQPGMGGIRFIIVQMMTWITAALSIAMPWTTLRNIGWLTALGVVPDQIEDPGSHRGLLIVGSALGMLSNTFCILGLMSFNPSNNIERREFERGKWKWNVFGESEAWWWLFLLLQGTLVVFSWQLAVMMEMSSAVKNNIVQSLMLMVITALLAIPLALTNAVAGKWKHGEKKYRLTMPCQGGAMYILLQALGWMLFSGAFIGTLFKLFATATASNTKVSISSTASLGIVSYFCIVASLFYFDPSKVDVSLDETMSETDGIDDVIRQEKKPIEEEELIVTILGKRQSPSVKHTVEYLVQWKEKVRSDSWVSEELLLKMAPAILKEQNEHVRTPRIWNRSSTKNNSHHHPRSKSPMVRGHLKLNEDEEEAEEAEGDEENDDTVEDSDDIWEEVEDENGNIYFFNEKTKVSQTQPPKKLKKALETLAST